MRTAVVLAVVAMAALAAALLAVGSPASAQSADYEETEILSATMTVGSHSSLDIKGYYNVGTNNYGGMSLTDLPSVVNAASDHYSIAYLLDSAVSNELHIGLGALQLEDLDREAYTLHIGERSFDFADATYSFSTATNVHAYSWPLSPRFGWADNETVAVSITSLPIVVHSEPRENHTAEIHYGGRGVHFHPHREHRRSAELHRPIMSQESGETATRTFEAGQSSFSNYHWAVDVDDDYNPVCTITWKVQAGDGYVVSEGSIGGIFELLRPSCARRRTGHDLPAGHVAPAPLQPLAGEGSGDLAMTMSNALPRFGMRTAVALAVLAVPALAALLAVSSPASAQTSRGEEIWSATMTVGNFPIGKGYTPEHGGIGSLSDTTVPVESQVYTVTFLNEGSAPSKQLRIGFNRLLNALDREVLALHVGGQTFDFEDAAYALDADYEHTYSWPHDPLFGWADSDTVAVSITALPVIHMLASPYTVEYGVAGNLEDATVQFTFLPHREREGSAELHPVPSRERRDRHAHVRSRAVEL